MKLVSISDNLIAERWVISQSMCFRKNDYIKKWGIETFQDSEYILSNIL